MSEKPEEDYVEIRLKIPRVFFNKIAALCSVGNPAKLTQHAYTVLHWVADAAARGRFVLSCNDKGEDTERLSVESLWPVKVDPRLVEKDQHDRYDFTKKSEMVEAEAARVLKKSKGNPSPK